jgi:EAL domain-containing protein (putative c-di-GMP-specific phosphodiesterase class I)
VPLGEWILREACTRLKAWQDTPSFPNDLWMSVNLSGVQLKDPTLGQRVSAAVRDSGVEPRSLVLELTESMAMENPTGVKSLLMQLRSTGVRISIDDFGTGYSSLSHLRQFPVDALKIDRSFVRGIETRQDSAAIVGTLTDMAVQLGLYVVAEGIENEQQLALLRSLRCHAAQGYLFAKPLDEAKATEVLRNGLPPRPAVRHRTTRAAKIPVPTWAWAAAAALVTVGAVGFWVSRSVAVGQAALPAVEAPTPAYRPVPDVSPAVTSFTSPPVRAVDSKPAPPLQSSVPISKPASPPTPVPISKAETVATAAPVVERAPAATTSLSIRVMHYHRVGSCVGRLVASSAGLAYVPDNKSSGDAFDFKYKRIRARLAGRHADDQVEHENVPVQGDREQERTGSDDWRIRRADGALALAGGGPQWCHHAALV